MPRLVSISEAAKLLAAAGDEVERSALSRYVTTNAGTLKPRKEGKAVLVDYEALADLRRRHLGKQHRDPAGPEPQPRERRPGGSAVGLADERMAKFDADRRLRMMTLAERVTSYTDARGAMLAAADAVARMRACLRGVVDQIAADLGAKVARESRRCVPILLPCVDAAHRAFQRSLKSSGILVDDVASLPDAPPDHGWRPADHEPATLDEARAAKTHIDRLHKELTIAIRADVVIPVASAEFAAYEAVAAMKLELANQTREIVGKVADALGVEAALIRGFPRALERIALERFAREMRQPPGRHPGGQGTE